MSVLDNFLLEGGSHPLVQYGLPLTNAATFLPNIQINPIWDSKISNVVPGSFEEGYAYLGFAVAISNAAFLIIATVFGGPSFIYFITGLLFFICMPLFGFPWFTFVDDFFRGYIRNISFGLSTLFIRLIRKYIFGYA